MRRITLFAFIMLTSYYSEAQCDFPRNNGTVQFQNAITYSGKMRRTVMPDERTIFSIDPSKLGFKTHDITGDTVPTSGEGVWMFKWNYAAQPHRWQPIAVDCDATSCSLKNLYGGAITEGWVECDFFYLDLKAGSSATFQGSVIYDIARGTGLRASDETGTGKSIN